MRLVAKEEKSGLVKGEKSGAAKNQNHNSLLTASRQLYLRLPLPPPLPFSIALLLPRANVVYRIGEKNAPVSVS